MYFMENSLIESRIILYNNANKTGFVLVACKGGVDASILVIPISMCDIYYNVDCIYTYAVEIFGYGLSIHCY